MNTLSETWSWLTTATHWSGPDGIWSRLGEHLFLTVVCLLISCLIALPVALVLGHLGKGGALAVNLSNIGRAVPTFAVLVLLLLTPIGTYGQWSTIIALVLFAVPPLLTNAYVGMREVDRDVVRAARGMGMTGRQMLWSVELPLALPLILTGVRIAAVQLVATATLAALAGGGGLGRIITAGFNLASTPQVVAGPEPAAPGQGGEGGGGDQLHGGDPDARGSAAGRAAAPRSTASGGRSCPSPGGPHDIAVHLAHPDVGVGEHGGTAKDERTRAMIVDHWPYVPMGVSSSRTRTAKVGTARPMLERLTASAPPLPRWPRTRATGRAIRQLMSRQTTVRKRCSPSRLQIPSGPDQWVAVVSQDQVSESVFMPASGSRGSAAAVLPGGAGRRRRR